MNKFFSFLILSFCLFFTIYCEVYFQDDFSDSNWQNRWVISKSKDSEGTHGKLGLTNGKYFKEKSDFGLQTQEDARFYQISSEFKEFSNEGKTLVLQFSVKHEQNIDCGGGYVKILPAGLNQEQFNGDSVYNIMFGPDICGSSRRTHLIFNYKGKNHLIEKDIRCETDEFTHVYTLVLNSDQTFQVLIDNENVRSGNLINEFKFLLPKEIKDPSKSKPIDWVELKEIDDPNAVKPEGWDNIPRQISDPTAVKPEDWDDELDGAWEAPQIPNPQYKGEWKASKIPNPQYKGEWVHPLIPNPDYYLDDKIYAFTSNKFIGIEIWQVKSGTIFDNFLITDDVQLAKSAAQTVLEQQASEKAQKEEELSKKGGASASSASGSSDDDSNTFDNSGEDNSEEFDNDNDDTNSIQNDDDDDERLHDEL
eukprot:TRINITY_DN780_c0_g1_i1.p1 TRINITY_DN780_c0_g1~~TRINITY_DN780_c0_g1_i1.p1  ORF type:complete len:436 (+),score=180.39 TRINITY_DN780_c0_g1_i1:47-1309(+)